MNEIQCGTCFEEYTEVGENVPLCVPCGHTFCSKCLTDLKKRGNLSCPACRRSVSIPVKDLPRNMFLIALIPIMGLTAKKISPGATMAGISAYSSDYAHSLSVEELERLLAMRKAED